MTQLPALMKASPPRPLLAITSWPQLDPTLSLWLSQSLLTVAGCEHIYICSLQEAGYRKEPGARGSEGKVEQSSTDSTPIPHDESWVQPQGTCTDTPLLSCLLPQGKGTILKMAPTTPAAHAYAHAPRCACFHLCTHPSTHMHTQA